MNDLQAELDAMLSTIPPAMDLAAGVLTDARAEGVLATPGIVQAIRDSIASFIVVLDCSDTPVAMEPGELAAAVEVARESVGSLEGSAKFWMHTAAAIRRMSPATLAVELAAAPDASAVYHRYAQALRAVADGLDECRRALIRGTVKPSPTSPTPDAGNPPGGPS